MAYQIEFPSASQTTINKGLSATKKAIAINELAERNNQMRESLKLPTLSDNFPKKSCNQNAGIAISAKSTKLHPGFTWLRKSIKNVDANVSQKPKVKSIINDQYTIKCLSIE